MSWINRRPRHHLAKGKLAEDIACDFLQDRGLDLITRNFTAKSGEIDLIMMDGEQVVFVEVRYRKNADYGRAEETVTAAKQKKIIQTAQYFLLQKKLVDQCACRFDIVAIQGTIPDHQINWIADAFNA